MNSSAQPHIPNSIHLIRNRFIKNRVIDISYSIYLAMLLVLILKPNLRDDEDALIGNIASIIIGALAALELPFMVYGWYQVRRDINRKVESLESEKLQTMRFNAETKDPKKRAQRLAKLDLTRLDTRQNFLVNYSKIDFDFDELTMQTTEINWKVGSNTLLKRVRQVHQFIQVLDEHFKGDINYQNCRKLIKTKNIPSFLNIFNLFKPHISHKVDVPTKLRCYILTCLPAVMVAKSLHEYDNNIAGFVTAYLIYNMLLVAASVADSYILNNLKWELNLEGFTNLNKPYDEWPPTCLGQQLTERLLFYPSNNRLKMVYDYLNDVANFFSFLRSNFPLPIEFKDKIDAFLNTVKITKTEDKAEVAQNIRKQFGLTRT